MSAEFTNSSSDAMPEIDLLLSGGGYRATIFHLGVLRFLWEYEDAHSGKPLLSFVKRVIGVSGGAITAAHFAINLGDFLALFRSPAAKLIQYATSFDIRRNYFENEIDVADSLGALLPHDASFASIARSSELRLDILGTDYFTGDGVAFTTSGIDYFDSVASAPRPNLTSDKLNSLRIRYAVAASAAFPPVFPPVLIEPQLFIGGAKQNELQRPNSAVADGGIRDNVGLEYYGMTANNARACVVSDAGFPFDWDRSDYVSQKLPNWGHRLRRVIDIQMAKLQRLEGRSLSNVYRLALEKWSGAPAEPDVDAATHAQPLPLQSAGRVARIKTDLAPLSGAQAFATLRLGYDVAERTLAQKIPQRFRKRPEPIDRAFWSDVWNDLRIGGPGTNPNLTQLEELLKQDDRPLVAGPSELLSHMPDSGFRSVDATVFVARQTLKHPAIAILATISIVLIGVVMSRSRLTTDPEGSMNQVKEHPVAASNDTEAEGRKAAPSHQDVAKSGPDAAEPEVVPRVPADPEKLKLLTTLNDGYFRASSGEAVLAAQTRKLTDWLTDATAEGKLGKFESDPDVAFRVWSFWFHLEALYASAGQFDKALTANGYAYQYLARVQSINPLHVEKTMPAAYAGMFSAGGGAAKPVAFELLANRARYGIFLRYHNGGVLSESLREKATEALTVGEEALKRITDGADSKQKLKNANDVSLAGAWLLLSSSYHLNQQPIHGEAALETLITLVGKPNTYAAEEDARRPVSAMIYLARAIFAAEKRDEVAAVATVKELEPYTADAPDGRGSMGFLYLLAARACKTRELKEQALESAFQNLANPNCPACRFKLACVLAGKAELESDGDRDGAREKASQELIAAIKAQGTWGHP